MLNEITYERISFGININKLEQSVWISGGKSVEFQQDVNAILEILKKMEEHVACPMSHNFLDIESHSMVLSCRYLEVRRGNGGNGTVLELEPGLEQGVILQDLIDSGGFERTEDNVVEYKTLDWNSSRTRLVLVLIDV